jgi:hypothetical protein
MPDKAARGHQPVRLAVDHRGVKTFDLGVVKSSKERLRLVPGSFQSGHHCGRILGDWRRVNMDLRNV